MGGGRDMILPTASEICIGKQTILFLSDVIDVSEYQSFCLGDV